MLLLNFQWPLRVKSIYLKMAHQALQDRGILLVSLAAFILTPPLWSQSVILLSCLPGNHNSL